MPEIAVLGFGSNRGNRLLNIKKAVKILALSADLNLLALSKIYETEPWGFKRQKYFLNCAAVFLCRLNPHGLLDLTKKTELETGRTVTDKWKEREIDIDILFFGNRKLSRGFLKIPHPFILQRNFVLKPLVDLIPGFVHPGVNKNIKSLYLKSKDICKVKAVGSFDK